MDERLAEAWREAASDLEIEVKSPYAVEIDGDAIACEVFLPAFGASSGALIVSPNTERKIRSVARKRGLWVAVVPTRAGGRKYDRRRFVDTLRDFQWFGPASHRPVWMD